MKGMKKCTSDIIISVVLLGFLLTLIMQMPEIPKDSNIGSVVITRAYLEKSGGPMIEMRG